MSRSAVIIIAVVLSGSTASYANSEFQQWMQQQKASFQEYKDKRDKEFTAFLKTNWKEMQLLKGVERDNKPKPVSMPVAKPVNVPDTNPVTRPAPVIVKAPTVPTTVPAPRVPTVSPAVPPVTSPPVSSADKPVQVPRQKPEPLPITRPEPVVIAPAPVIKAPPVIKPKPVIEPAPAVKNLPPAVPVYKQPDVTFSGRKLVIDFYGESLTIYYDPRLKISVPYRLNKRAISDTWSKLSKSDYEPLLKQLDAIRQQKVLNDWAFAVLTNTVAQGITANRNAQSFISWFVLVKAGYEARIAYSDTDLYLLLPTQQQLFAVPYFIFDNIRYYAVSFDGKSKTLGRVFTYDGQYPGADEALDMKIASDMVVTGHDQTRKLKFSFKGKRYEIDAKYNKERVEFMNTYPQLDLGMYFTSKVATDSANSLHSQLARYMQDMSKQDAVNFLLRFVQTSLQYKTDDEQFGEENYLFPEETLYYRYSDCEDRSVLFAWLVRNLLGLEVVGLDFPGHVATAVHFTSPVSGDAISYKGKRFTVADPTYINAVAGMTMPDYKNITPKVIAIN